MDPKDADQDESEEEIFENSFSVGSFENETSTSNPKNDDNDQTFSDTDDEIEKAVAKSALRKVKLKNSDDIYELSTEEEDYTSQKTC